MITKLGLLEWHPKLERGVSRFVMHNLRGDDRNRQRGDILSRGDAYKSWRGTLETIEKGCLKRAAIGSVYIGTSLSVR